MDKIRQKYGRAAIVQGSVIDTDIGIYEKRPQAPGERKDKT